MGQVEAGQLLAYRHAEIDPCLVQDVKQIVKEAMKEKRSASSLKVGDLVLVLVVHIPPAYLTQTRTEADKERKDVVHQKGF